MMMGTNGLANCPGEVCVGSAGFVRGVAGVDSFMWPRDCIPGRFERRGGTPDRELGGAEEPLSM